MINMKPLIIDQYTPHSANICCSELSCLVENNYVLKPFDDIIIDLSG